MREGALKGGINERTANGNWNTGSVGGAGAGPDLWEPGQWQLGGGDEDGRGRRGGGGGGGEQRGGRSGWPSGADRSRADRSRAGPSRAEPGRAGPRSSWAMQASRWGSVGP